METRTASSHRHIVLIGMLSLAIAMGIGRFAFTPLMPLMLRDGSINADTGSEWAAANYLGYLLGALSAAWFRHAPRKGLCLGLGGVCITTLGMALLDHAAPATGACLRAAAGVCSAWVLVCCSSWCLPALSAINARQSAGWVYAGVGLGITATGLLIWLGAPQAAHRLWSWLGLAALAGSILVWQQLVSRPDVGASGQHQATPQPERHASHRPTGLVISYGVFGFAYIVPATYLPTMARQLVADPMVFGLAWPLFGLAAVLGIAMLGLCHPGHSQRKAWAVSHVLMALGIILPVLHHAIWVIALGAMLIGGTFMVATMAGLQLARDCWPANPAPVLARMTASFAAGQITGPVLIRLIGSAGLAGLNALDSANVLASGLLLLSAIWLWHAPRQPISGLAG